MKDITNKTASFIAGGLSGFNGYLGISNLLEYINDKSTIVQKLLSEQPIVTKEIFEIAEKTAQEIIGSANQNLGLFGLAFSGVCAGAAIYYANRQHREY